MVIGQTLGSYQVLAKLGEGGMGIVYRARDTKLNRDVALKVLPDVFADDPERLARFQREAHVLASLNHPNIAQIHGLEESGETRALVLEYVDGPTLAEMLQAPGSRLQALGPRAGPEPGVRSPKPGTAPSEGGALPIDEALAIARQIAEALEAAHEAGVIHRDLKPANVKVKSDGMVKVLDFGLAKALEGEAGADPSQSPTMTAAATRAGVIMGTAAYMSPEQARGKVADKRADIWAFGAVLYEMLTGRQTFAGETVSETLAAVMKSAPEWDSVPADTPTTLQNVVRRCLEKDPKRRIRDIGDVRLAMDGVFETPSLQLGAAASVPSGQARGWRVALPWSLAATLAITTGVLTWVRDAPGIGDPRTPVRFSVSAPPGTEFTQQQRPVFSPDGSTLIFTLTRGTSTQLYLRRLDQAEAMPISGTQGALRGFFSSDGRWVYFIDPIQRTLNKVSVEGGTPLPLTAADFDGAVSGPNDTVIYTRSYSEGLWQISSDGGIPQKLTEPDESLGELGHWWPQLLPDGQTVLFTSISTPVERSRVLVYSLLTGEQEEVIAGGYFGRYVATGHILFARGQSVLAVPFDLSRLETGGPAVPVLDDIQMVFSNGEALFSVSERGALAFIRASEASGNNRLIWVDRTGAARPIDSTLGGFKTATLSPDGRRLALTIDDGGRDVWVLDLERGGRTKVTFGQASEFAPIWTPDSNGLVYTVEEPQYHIYSRSLDGGGEERLLHGGPHDSVPTSISPDGKFLVFEQNLPDTGLDVWMLSLEGEEEPKALVQTPFAETYGTVSPDGRWLAYQSNESGRDEIYVRSFPEPSERQPISVEGGTWPAWSRDGRELFYRRGDQLIAVPVRTTGEFSTGQPVALFERRTIGLDRYRVFDPSPDGSFVFVERDPNAPPVSVHVVLNWFEELKSRAPTN